MLYRYLNRHPWLVLTLGLLLGVAATIASQSWWLGREHSQLADFPWRQVLLNADATHGNGSMAIATGDIDGEVEGLFLLDSLTGDLTCVVLNPKTMQLGGLFKHNVTADLGVQQGKTPQYMLVTGRANFRTTGGAVRPAGSIVYVADSNTGRYAAYVLPWNRAAASYNFAQANPMHLIGADTVRNITVE